MFYTICNLNTPQINNNNSISSKERLKKIKKDNPYLLNIHLNWDGQSLNNNYGFDVASYIRSVKKSFSPIIFYSPVQKEYFEYKSKTSIKYKLLFARGSAFLESPFDERLLLETINNTPPLNESSLHDVVTMLTDIKGIVLDKLNHNLKFDDEVLPQFSEVEPYLSERQKTLIDFDKYSQKLEELNKKDEHSFYEIKETFLSLCNTHLTEKGKETRSFPSSKHKVLIVEDDKSDLEKATSHLEKNFEVVSTRKAEEAINILDKDLSNEILAVISDWRLYNDDSQTYWQKYQGYEVLEHASKTGFRALFALTSQADFVVHQIRNALNFRFTLLKKQNLKNPEQWHLFSDILHTSCNDVLTTFSEMPSSAKWKKQVKGISYKELYLQKKQSLDFFDSVADKADEVWGYLLKEKENDFKNFKLIRDKFGLEVPKTNLDLFVVLVLRLMWFAFWYNLDNETNTKDPDIVNKHFLETFRVISKGNWRGILTPNDVNVELNKICLTKKDILQKNLLPHERSWLIKHNLIN